MLVEKYGWAIQKSLFAETNQDSTFSHTRENSKMFNITSKYFSTFNNKPPAKTNPSFEEISGEKLLWVKEGFYEDEICDLESEKLIILKIPSSM